MAETKSLGHLWTKCFVELTCSEYELVGIDMNEETTNARELAFKIEFEGRIDAVLSKHTVFICWNKPGESPVRTQEDGATGCLIQSGNLRFVATCSHVWKSYLRDVAEKGANCLWLGLVANDSVSAPVFPHRVANPILIAESTGLDLATFTFDGINSLERWRFYRMRNTPRQKVRKGEGVFFSGYPRDIVRASSASRRLGFTGFRLTVTDVSYCRFLLSDQSGTRHMRNRFGKETQHHRIPGVSGAPVFRLGNLGVGPPDLFLAGTVSIVGSPSLTKSTSEPVGLGSKGDYELSDGDMHVVHAQFIHADGLIYE